MDSSVFRLEFPPRVSENLPICPQTIDKSNRSLVYDHNYCLWLPISNHRKNTLISKNVFRIPRTLYKLRKKILPKKKKMSVDTALSNLTAIINNRLGDQDAKVDGASYIKQLKKHFLQEGVYTYSSNNAKMSPDLLKSA